MIVVEGAQARSGPAPWRFNFTPRASASRCTEISRFNRSIVALRDPRHAAVTSFYSFSGFLRETLSRGSCDFLNSSFI